MKFFGTEVRPNTVTRVGDWSSWLIFMLVFVAFVLAIHVSFAPLLSLPAISLGLLIIAVLPAFLIAQHGVYLFRFKPRAIQRALSSPKKIDQPGGYSFKETPPDPEIRELIGEPVHQTIFMYFIVAGAVAVVSIILFTWSFSEASVMHDLFFRARPQTSEMATHGSQASRSRDDDQLDPSRIWWAFRLSAAGAFIYTLIVLGKRNFQRDISPGLSCWCLVQLVLGPALGCALAIFLSEGSPTKTSPPSNHDPATMSFGISVLYFFAGLSPRLIADLISETASRMWPGASPFQHVGMRVVPLGQVRGITRAIEDRLLEEGIEDTLALSLANPLRLMRNTPFDPRLILGWIDEAYLIMTLPQQWQALENEGITGVMDLSWYSWYLEREIDVEGNNQATEPLPAQPNPLPPEPGAQNPDPGQPAEGASVEIVDNQPPTTTAPTHETPPAAKKDPITKLADRINMRPDALREVIVRLGNDSQVGLLWALYDRKD